MRRAWPGVRGFTIAVAAVAAFASAGRANAGTDGRLTVMNDAELLQNPSATIDAALIRLWMQSEKGNHALIVDLRSDLPVMAQTTQKYGPSAIDGSNISTPFNGACHGDNYDTNRKKCEDIGIRDATLGQMTHLAGIYDLFYRIGSQSPGKTTVSLGRKTVYEAGLSTVDGLTIERMLSAGSRVGAFLGTAPDPVTRMFDPYYQTAGGYVALMSRRVWVRGGLTALNYAGSDANKELFGATKGALARATLFNQNFVLLAKGVSLGTFLNFDVIPGPVDRLVYADLSIKPTSRYGIRFNATRFRPIEFDQTPELLNGVVNDPQLITAYLSVTSNGRLSGSPEVVPQEYRIKPIDMGKVAVHYVTAASITPFASVEYRMREVDNKTQILADVGAYTYDPYDTGLVGRARVEIQQGYDASGFRVGGNLDREVTESFRVGGGVDVGSWTYKLRNPALEVGYPKSAHTLAANALVRYDRPTGLSVFLEAYYYMESRKRGTGEVTGGGNITQPAPTSYSTLSALLGFTWRFGTGGHAPR